jgi:phage tail sheath protein FI
MDHHPDGDADALLDGGTTDWGGVASGTFNAKGIIVSGSLTGGTAGTAATAGNIQTALDEYKNTEEVDVTLLMTGDADAATAIYAINNIAEYRKDCVAFISPTQANVVNNSGSEVNDVISFRNSMPSSSYAVLDSGWKYMYDKYNDVFRYVPLNGDVAGCCAFTDEARDPFWSPAGIDRGNIRNAIKLPFSPNKTQRDDLYKNGINPVTAMPGSGILLFGDKTLLAKPSAFDRINVRRLFILLEKSIAIMANSFLFEFNDAFTRSRFVATVEPFLRDIQGRGGVQDFSVVCDEGNNPGDVVDRNEFRGDIYIKPSRSINFIQLQFVAVRSGVEFEEITGG